jgi:hypothetical protein
MNPLIEGLPFNPRLSTLTLAFFADSGWYQVDLSRASVATGWGRGAGCPFVFQPCISPDGKVPSGFESYFCNDNPVIDGDGFAVDINGCTADLSRKAACSIGRYNGTLPKAYRYFGDTLGSDVGGSDPFMDYCPVFDGFSNGLCSDPENEALIRIDRMERFGERNSRCIAGEVNAGRTALCLRIACVVEDRSFRVQVGGIWKKCSYKNERIVSAYGDRLICPDPILICPTFYCPLDCLGTRRMCNYTLGKCVCENDASCYNESRVEPFRKYIEYNASLPDADSPLHDYYVTNVRVLKDEPKVDLEAWEIVIMATAATILITAFVIMYMHWRRKSRQTLNTHGGTDDNDGGPTVNPNKDKMIATVVVDMRMNDPNLHDGVRLGRVSETDMSMTDSAAGSHAPSDLDTTFGFQQYMDQKDVDVGEEPSPEPSPSIVRRRNIRTEH